MSIVDALKRKGSTGGRNIAEAIANLPGGSAGGRNIEEAVDKLEIGGGGIDAFAQYDFSEAIGSSATYVGSYAFGNCFGLTTASFPNASYIGEGAFGGCSSLTEASFPNASSIGIYAFASCTGLTDVSFPNVSYIGDAAFQHCSSLTSVSFPNVSYIGDGAFYLCTSLISLYLTGGSLSQVPTLSEYVFYDTPIGGNSGSVYVPASLYSAFLTAPNWSSISARIVSVADD